MKVTVCDLIANKHTQYTEADREWLSVLNEEQLASMVPVNIPEAKEVTANAEPPKQATFEELLAAAPAVVKARFDFVDNMIAKQRTDLIARIKSNSVNKYTDDMLNTMSDELLQATADSFAPVANYAGAGGGFTPVANADGEEPLLLPTINEKKDDDKK